MKITEYCFLGFKSLKNNGIRATLQKVKRWIFRKKAVKRWNRSYFISKEERIKQTNATFHRPVLFSIVVPVYNTPMKYFMEMIESVQKQTYVTWELCLADGSEENYQKQLEAYCKKIEDKRIRYKKLEKNQGISENTNEALRMARGEYIGLLDHDDILHTSALYEAMCVIEKENADFIYTDEATFEGKITNLVTIHFKPDYGLDTLRANNYICHFSVFKKALLEKTGNFRKEYDGSQDHDIVLRLTREAKKICHIPKLLYFWRSHEFSVAKSVTTKSYAVDAGIRAVKTSIETYGEQVLVESSKQCPTIYRLHYALKEEAFVSIIIIGKEKEEYTKQCIQSILEKTLYKNYEIITVEFSLSSINECIKSKAIGEYLIFLDNTTKISSPSWIKELLMYAQRKDIGVVGAKLCYLDNTIRHAGIFIGLGMDDGIRYSHRYQPKEAIGYMGRLCYAQNVSAVTGECMMVRKELYEVFGGFEKDFSIYYDIDFCMKVRRNGYAIIFTPYAELYYCKSKLKDSLDKKELERLKQRWREEWNRYDPYYNPNLKDFL